MMFFTMADAAKEIAPVVEGGACDTTYLYDRINTATRRLLMHDRKPIHIRRLVRFFTKKDIITLPRGVERIVAYTMDGAPAPLFSSAYEFVSHGPGELCCDPSWVKGKYLEDMGAHYSLFFDIPSYDDAGGCGCTSSDDDATEPSYTGVKVVAFSTKEADRGVNIRLWGQDSDNAELHSASPGLLLGITPWDNETEGDFTYAANETPTLTDPLLDIHWVKKPVTEGFVSLYGYNESTYQLYFLAKYHPFETQPRYRRYRITSPDYCCGTSILALCELGYVPMSVAEDILIIQNIDALKMMCMAIGFENANDLERAVAHEGNARRMIEDQRRSERTHDYNLIQMSAEYGLGSIKAR